MDQTLAASSVQSSGAKRVLVVIGAALGMSGGFATVFLGSAGVFLKPIAAEFAWSRSQLSAMMMCSMLGLALSGPLFGVLIDRIGGRKVVWLAILMLVGGLSCLAVFPKNYWLFSGACFFIGLGGAGTSPPGYLSVFPGWFNRRLGLALGCAMFGLGIGAFLMPVMVQSVIAAYGWRQAYAACAMIALILGFVATQMIFSGTSPVSIASKKAKSQALAEGETLGEAVRTVRFWIMAVVLLLIAAAGVGATVHAAALFSDRGLTPTLAARAAALIGAGLAPGRLVSGILMDRFHAPVVAAVSFVAGASGLFLITVSGNSSFTHFAIGAVLLGFTLGTEGDIMPYFVRRYFGTKSFSTIYGLLFAAFSIGGVVGPITFGLAYDKTGSYFNVSLVAAGLCLTCAVAILSVGRYRYR